MKSWCKKYYVHVILVGLVAVVGGVAAFLYIDQFGANGFSKKTGDWANFATYISGTVGVAAVTATLIAFVITLSQQKALLKSQDEMLVEQRNNIEILELQYQREKAYKYTLEAFPLLINNFKSALKAETSVYFLNREADNVVYSSKDFRTLHGYFDLNGESIELVEESMVDPLDDVYTDYGPVQFYHLNKMCLFIEQQVAVDADLISIFDFYLSQDLGYGQDGWFYMECYRNFQVGRGRINDFPAPKKYDFRGFAGDPFDYYRARQWLELGEKVKGQ